MATKRNYKAEYARFHSSTKAKKARAKRNAARRAMTRAGRVSKGDGKDVDHIRGVKAGNGRKNLRVMSASANRGRRQASRVKGSKRK